MLYLAEKLGKPLLAEGPAGVGKTELPTPSVMSLPASSERPTVPFPTVLTVAVHIVPAPVTSVTDAATPDAITAKSLASTLKTGCHAA